MTAAPETRISISGMSCAGCVSRVEKALNAVPGVTSASVNLVSQQASVSGTANVSALLAAIQSLGYGAELINNGESAGSAPEGDGSWWPVILSGLLSLPLVVPMLLLPFGLDWHAPPAVQAALATVVQAVFGARFYQGAWSALRHGSASMDVLVSLGTTGAWALSLYLLVQGAETHHALYFEASTVVITLVLLGRRLEQGARRRTRAAIDALAAMQPAMARRLSDEQESLVPITALRTGDLVRVRAGDAIPADGRILRGISQIDEAMLTGESVPAQRNPGDAVAAGTRALDGTLDIEVTGTGRETTLARILAWVESAQASKAPVQQLADRISAIFVPVVTLLALMTLAALVISGHSWEEAIIRAVTVLVIACPCALGLATPVALMAGTGAAARAGILIRDISALEDAARIDTVAFDKTGTLTLGKPAIVTVHGTGDDTPGLIAIAAGLQSCTTHPLADAFRQQAQTLGVIPMPVSQAQLTAGLGVRGVIDGEAWVLGNEAWLSQHGVTTEVLRNRGRDAADRGETLVWLASLGPPPSVKAVFGLADTLRDDAATTVQRLRDLGIDTLMITGDHAQSARRIASRLGISILHASVLPEAKAGIIDDIRQKGHRVAMVGDGINDAPALACADLGIALGTGTDVARHTAAITLVGRGLARVPDALVIARRTRNALRQNLFLAFAYNVIGIPLAMAGMLNPMIAGAAMAASSLSVVANALRLNRWRPRAHTIPGPSPV
jgi:Cu+-exporting ATPase